MTVFLILVTLFIAWHFIPKPKPAEPRPRFRKDHRIRVDDPQWPRFAEEHCESPAEVKFLKAAIAAFGLRPQNESLRGGGLQIDFQVEEGRYRVDFLANRWLVVEIDGATYHSSPEAQTRDRLRDAYFEELGYSVLRIPAKTVFDQPDEALKRLRSALAVGKRQSEPLPPQSGFQRLRETGASLGSAVAQLNGYVERELAKEKALSEARLVVAQERQVIEIATETAETNLFIQEKTERDKEFEQTFKRHWAEIESFFDEPTQSSPNIVVPEFPPLPTHPDASTANSIEAEYEVLQESRSKLFEETRRKVLAEPRLKPLIEKALTEMGCRHVISRVPL